MYVIEDKGGAIALILAALIFLGTWPAVLSLLEQRGRLPQHTYLDYSITNLLAAVLIALTFGQIGDSKHNMPNFLTQLTQDNWPSILFAMAGGIVLSLGNLSTQYAWAYVGLSVTAVIASSIIVVIGTTMNYFLDDRINKAEILFPGVGCFLIAVCLGSVVHSSNAADNEKKLSGSSSNYKAKTRYFRSALGSDLLPGDVDDIPVLAEHCSYRLLVSAMNRQPNNVKADSLPLPRPDHSICRRRKQESLQVFCPTSTIVDQELSKDVPNKDVAKDIENGVSYASEEIAKVGTAEYLIQLESRRSIKVLGSNAFVGLSIVFFAGVCFSLFSPAFNLATNDQWHTLKKGVPHLVVYTAFFYFSVSCFVIGVALNIWFLYNPLLGLPKSSFTAYLKDWNGRHWALLAGVLCGFGNGFQFMGGQAAGYAAADAVQALPLVSTFWGIFLFGEYRRSSKKTYVLLVSMLFMFVVAVAVLMTSSGHRKT